MRTKFIASAVMALIASGCATSEPGRSSWKVSPLFAVQHGMQESLAFFEVGRHFQREGRPERAAIAFAKAIDIDPSNVAALNALGSVQMQLGRTEDGLQTLKRAVNLAPGRGYLHNNLGYALLLAEQNDQAVAALQNAVALDNNDRRAWANLATAYRRLGAFDRAELAEARASGKWNTATNAVASVAAASSAALPAPPGGGTPPAPVAPPPPQAAAPAPTITVGTITAEPSPATMPISTLPPRASSPVDTPPAERPPRSGPKTRTSALGFAPVTPTTASAAAAPVVTATPRATLVKVAENVFELRYGPSPQGAAVAEAAAIIAAAGSPPPHQVVAPLLRGVDASASMPSPGAAAMAPSVPATRYEISNGHGGEGLARRLAGLLGQQGFARPRLTNQPPYNLAESVIQYRDGYRASAEAFASLLPFRPEVRAAATANLAVDVRLVLGRDLTTSDACAVLGLCMRVARTSAPRLVAADSRPD